MATKDILAANLADMRGTWELSQEELADAAGVSVDIISALENGDYDAPLSTLEGIAKGLRCTVNALLQPRLSETKLFDSTEDLQKWLEDNDYGETIYMDEPEPFLGAIVGISEDGRLIYDYNKMIQCLVEDGMDVDEAVDTISYNTLRAIPYMERKGKAPIVIFGIDK